MIATLGVEGYRAFSSPTTMSLRRLTVIFGKNNSGKTTLTRLPLFIGASLHSAGSILSSRDACASGTVFEISPVDMILTPRFHTGSCARTVNTGALICRWSRTP